MEKDIILEGIIKYTREKKIEWRLASDGNFEVSYDCNYKIQGSKFINIIFNYDYKTPNKSKISIRIVKKYTKDLFSVGESSIPYATINSDGRINSLRVLIGLITPDKKIKT